MDISFSFNIYSWLLAKMPFRMHNATLSHSGFRPSFATSLVLICCWGEFPLSEIANRFELVSESNATAAIVLVCVNLNSGLLSLKQVLYGYFWLEFLLFSIMRLCWPDIQCETGSSIHQYLIVCVAFCIFSPWFHGFMLLCNRS